MMVKEMCLIQSIAFRTHRPKGLDDASERIKFSSDSLYLLSKTKNYLKNTLRFLKIGEGS